MTNRGTFSWVISLYAYCSHGFQDDGPLKQNGHYGPQKERGGSYDPRKESNGRLKEIGRAEMGGHARIGKNSGRRAEGDASATREDARVTFER